jgi:hypothetical protein
VEQNRRASIGSDAGFLHSCRKKAKFSCRTWQRLTRCGIVFHLEDNQSGPTSRFASSGVHVPTRNVKPPSPLIEAEKQTHLVLSGLSVLRQLGEHLDLPTAPPLLAELVALAASSPSPRERPGARRAVAGPQRGAGLLRKAGPMTAY